MTGLGASGCSPGIPSTYSGGCFSWAGPPTRSASSRGCWFERIRSEESLRLLRPRACSVRNPWPSQEALRRGCAGSSASTASGGVPSAVERCIPGNALRTTLQKAPPVPLNLEGPSSWSQPKMCYNAGTTIIMERPAWTYTALAAIVTFVFWGSVTFVDKLAASRIGARMAIWCSLGPTPLAVVYGLIAPRLENLVQADRIGIRLGLLGGAVASVGEIAFRALLARSEARPPYR